MDKLKVKHQQLKKALATLQKSIDLYNFLKSHEDPYHSKFYDHEEAIKGQRDSVIQRFEYSVDMSWKYLKDYLQLMLKINLESVSPRAVVRDGAHAQILTEQEADAFLLMIDHRNNTSHRYKEEIAEMIFGHMTSHLELLEQVASRTAPQS